MEVRRSTKQKYKAETPRDCKIVSIQCLRLLPNSCSDQTCSSGLSSWSGHYCTSTYTTLLDSRHQRHAIPRNLQGHKAFVELTPWLVEAPKHQ